MPASVTNVKLGQVAVFRVVDEQKRASLWCRYTRLGSEEPALQFYPAMSQEVAEQGGDSGISEFTPNTFDLVRTAVDWVEKNPLLVVS